MASHKKVTLWALIGSLWTAWWLFIVIWITWFDYPRTTDIYAGFLGDGTWFWHEIALPIGIWFFGLMTLVITRFWMALASFLETIQGIRVLPDGQVAFVRRKRKQ